MPRLAIVLSAVGSIESLEATLVSVLENRPADSEILVALREPYADPYDLKDEVKFIAPRRRTTAIAAINEALAATRAPFVHLLASGCTVSEGWVEPALSRFGDRRLGSVVPWVEDADRPGRLFAVGIGYRTRGERHRIGQGADASSFEPPASILGPGMFAAFYRKAALDLAGGFSNQLGIRQADADLAHILKHAGLTIAVEPRSRISATASADSPASAVREALCEERLYWRNSRGGMVGHLALAAWDVIRGLPRPTALARMVGRSRGMLEFSSHARHRQHLAELARRAVPPQLSEHVRIDTSHDQPTRETERVRSTSRMTQ